jgi:ABC-type uncharacterized transport system substrate-binding protein
MQFDQKRREFITLLGGAAAWPLAARAAPDQVRRIGILSVISEGDPQVRANRSALESGLHALGWIVERNIHLESHWTDDESLLRKYAAELVGASPDVLITEGTAALAPVKRATKSIPIVFVNVSDPIGQGFVASLARPGGNATGFTLSNFRWLLNGLTSCESLRLRLSTLDSFSIRCCILTQICFFEGYRLPPKPSKSM